MPLFDNDGVQIDDLKFKQTWDELAEQFGAVSQEVGRIRGQWTFGEKRFEDESIRFFVDCPDSRDARRFFLQYKDVLKGRFQQIDIWITKHTVEII